MMKEKINIENLLTAQEDWFRGSTSDHIPKTEEEWHIPIGVLLKKMTIARVSDLRIEFRDKIFFSTAISNILGVKGQMVLGLALIDQNTGVTTADPFVLGIRRYNSQTIEDIPGRNLTEELRGKYREFNVYETMHLREFDMPKGVEKTTSSEEKK